MKIFLAFSPALSSFYSRRKREKKVFFPPLFLTTKGRFSRDIFFTIMIRLHVYSASFNYFNFIVFFQTMWKNSLKNNHSKNVTIIAALEFDWELWIGDFTDMISNITFINELYSYQYEGNKIRPIIDRLWILPLSFANMIFNSSCNHCNAHYDFRFFKWPLSKSR